MNQKLNQSIWSIPMPDRIKRLPISATGFPVPWFVAWIDGLPDFRVIGPDKMVQAVNRKLCWVCGQPLGVHKAFPLVDTSRPAWRGRCTGTTSRGSSTCRGTPKTTRAIKCGMCS